jgi:transcriptional regulator with PAS, ATPase and Fis domain
VSRLIAEYGLRPVQVEGIGFLRERPPATPPATTIIVVGIGGVIDRPDLDIIRSLKGRGAKVICYQDDFSLYPLRLRCEVLLAGALDLLDSSQDGFAPEIRNLIGKVLEAEQRRTEEKAAIKGEMERLGMIGESEAMLSVYRWIARASQLSDFPILVTGETGAGKELVALAIYRLDPKRRHGPFVTLNCGAISHGLAESELFGHRRGAFTGAERDRKGLIRSAQGGVFFLDEIGEMDDALQVKLLRVIQEGKVLGVGEDQEAPVNVRIIAATNRNLDEMVRQGRFRADLYHRLNILSVHLPPLRERPDDIAPLVRHFVKKYRPPKTPQALAVSSDVIAALKDADLPGNVRELENIICQAILDNNDETQLNLRDLPVSVLRQLSEKGWANYDSSPQPAPSKIQGEEEKESRQFKHDLKDLLNVNGWNLSQSLQYCERILLESALHLACGNHTKTAKLLGISPRSVYNKIHKYHLPF